MGIDTNIVSFNADCFKALQRRLDRLRGKAADRASLESFQATEELVGKVQELLASGAPQLSEEDIADIGVRAFYGECAPKTFSFTGSSVRRYFCLRSPFLSEFFALGQSSAEDMSMCLGPDAILLTPEVARALWTAVWESWPDSEAEGQMGSNQREELIELRAVGELVDKASYSNVALAFY